MQILRCRSTVDGKKHEIKLQFFLQVIEEHHTVYLG